MDKMIGILQLLFAGVFGAMAVGTLINMVFIATRPETISVVNAMVGQTLMVICLLAFARILFRKGSLRVRPKE
ncbi:MAG: hypothetical protein KDI28_03225 [Pseudomonadales bacterium]|nr:hypothetical protein [Pseudomonadales bacterium]MCP5356567.1 hypothetical protein [Pseudomonadales bacterium]